MARYRTDNNCSLFAFLTVLQTPCQFPCEEGDMKGCINCLWFKTIDHGTKAHCDAMVFDKVYSERTSMWNSFVHAGRIKRTKRFHTPCKLYESVGAL